jgi:predicted phosphoribosyltransferase
VPVAFEVAAAFGVALEVFVARKIGAPGHEELAVAAIAEGLEEPVA